jgi:stage III sporulation protein SpoIIIAA
MATTTAHKEQAMNTTKIERTDIEKAYSTVVNTLHGNTIEDHWKIPTVDEAWSWGSEYALVRLSDGKVYRIRLELTDNGYAI